MIPIRLQQIAEWTGGALIQGQPDALVYSVSTDTRKGVKDSLFIALKGDRFDAHRFLGDVADGGAAAILVSELPESTESYEGGIVFVRDTLRAMQDQARRFRRAVDDLRVIGVTGSNGKTSTKDFLASVLSRGGEVNATAGNFNNHIGVPLTVFATEPGTRFGVWEMGMNHAGEIEVLAEIAAPDAAVVTHIGTAHIENLETRDAIAEEKSQLPRSVPASGYCVMPARDDYHDYVARVIDCELVPVGGEKGFVRAEDLRVLENGRTGFRLASDAADAVDVSLGVRGEHMVQNALLAAAVGLREGIEVDEIAEALAEARLTGGRLEEKSVGEIRVLDDSYNANPDSMRAAIRTLMGADTEGRRVAVLGFMGELGEIAEREHVALGTFLTESGVDALVTVGSEASRINEGASELPVGENFDTHDEAADFLLKYLEDGDLVLFKGSRAADMGRVLDLLQ